MSVPLEQMRKMSPEARASHYLLPQEILSEYEYPRMLDLEAREKVRKYRPGADFAVTNYQGRLCIVPPWHPAFRKIPEIAHGMDYGSGVFEGLSLVPIVQEGEIVGANIVLFEPRMERLRNSLRGRLLLDRVDIEAFEQIILDLAAISCLTALRDTRGTPSRAYIRPSIKPGDGPLGVGIKKDHDVLTNVKIFNWPEYLDVGKALSQGLTVAATPSAQRLESQSGKYASNYGNTGVIGNWARAREADEALLLAPYIIVNGQKEYVNAQAGEKAVNELLKSGNISDGVGEDVIGLKGKTLYYLPVDVNRLNWGTTLAYVVNYMAPALGFSCYEKPFGFEDIRGDKIDSLLFLGNAVTVLPIGEIKIFTDVGKTSPREVFTLPPTEEARLLATQFRDEMNGRVPPSHSSLLTPVNLQEGKTMRDVLMKAYADWFK